MRGRLESGIWKPAWKRFERATDPLSEAAGEAEGMERRGGGRKYRGQVRQSRKKACSALKGKGIESEVLYSRKWTKDDFREEEGKRWKTCTGLPRLVQEGLHQSDMSRGVKNVDSSNQKWGRKTALSLYRIRRG